MEKLRAVWSRLVDGLWFVPSIIVLAAVLLAVGMIELSAVVSDEALARWPRIFGASAASSRSILSAIASSMITVAGVTFSITMVAVTQASSQYTPRILRNFMRDRANQVVLGVFVGIFAYCLVVLRTIRGADELSFVPSLAVLLGVLLAVLGIAVLIFFVHHIATTLQASEIVAHIMGETIEAIDRLFPDKLGTAGPEPDPETLLAAVPVESWSPVPARATGYLQRMDGAALGRIAGDQGLVVRLNQEVGSFVVAGLPLAWIAPDPSISGDRRQQAPHDLLGRQFTISNHRAIDRDVGFGIRQLVDIALKALSPGINDTTTAVTCVDYLGAILVRMAGRRIDPFPRGKGTDRLVAPGPTFESLVQSAFDEIRQHSRGNVSVLVRQIQILELVAGALDAPGRRRVLLYQIALMSEEVGRTVPSASDRDHLGHLADRARAAAGGACGTDPSVLTPP